MSLEAVWEDLERLHSDGREGRYKRRIEPQSSLDLFVAVAKPTNQRMLLMLVSEGSLEGLDELPTSQGVEARVARPGEDGREAALELVLTDTRFADMFGALANDISGAVVAAKDEPAAVAVFVGRLRRWQRFLEEGGLKGLASEQQRGLYAELWLLREHLLPSLGPAVAVAGWTGPSHASHDFQLGAVALEAKATAAKQHQLLRIVSERQLDDTGVEHLLLFHLSLDVHQHAGESLPAIVEDIRERIHSTVAAPGFDDKLLDAGYLDAHSELYADSGYAIREQNFFRVGQGFPRIVERDLPTGVGDVHYSVSVAECRHFSVDAGSVKDMLRSGSVKP